MRRDGWIAEDEYFYPEQNARLVRDAEEYYQQMYRAEVSSWNLRDRHMAGTLDALIEHLDQQLRRAKIVVWEHNSHVGDARATVRPALAESHEAFLHDSGPAQFWLDTAQFDAVIHLDRTRAIEPLERSSLRDESEPPETFPSGI